ncbi:hypothetical protein TGRH88_042610 [Toxoplasma gondii]|uniref:Casein kinase substrate phosphoprotein PP28 domain-containing protein n=8 Tax=Toxoplasma gondii TaxID=5811 RepID=A0A0F7V7M9_TOXGV|nr:hypothetical protein TGRH88_042610 [Toxoplasma gondii]CEL76802.1 TPA: hypothetical protein BN1205_062890 [Toxoplasma gondii VEG]
MSGRGRGRGGSRGRGKPRGGRGARRVATFEEVMERNAMLERRETREEEASSEEEEEDEEEEEEPTKFKRPLDFLRQRMKEDGDDSEEEEEELSINLGSMRLSTANPNRDRRAIEKTGVVELSRREREELERQRRQRIYEKLHAEGKTAEAKADLARLAEVRRRREEAARLRAQNGGA